MIPTMITITQSPLTGSKNGSTFLLVVVLFCSNVKVLLHFASRVPNIDRSVSDIWPWPWPQSKVNDDKQWCQSTFSHCWTLTLDLQPWSTFTTYLGSRSTTMPKMEVLYQAVQPWEGGQTERQMEGQTLSNPLFPCFAVDKKCQMERHQKLRKISSFEEKDKWWRGTYSDYNYSQYNMIHSDTELLLPADLNNSHSHRDSGYSSLKYLKRKKLRDSDRKDLKNPVQT